MITEVASNDGIRQLSIVAPTTVDGAWTDLGQVNLGGQYEWISIEVTNSHATVPLTDFELAIIAAPWVTVPTPIPYIAGGGLWVSGVLPERVVYGNPDVLGPVTTAAALVRLYRVPSIMFRARQTIDLVAAVVTINITLTR